MNREEDSRNQEEQELLELAEKFEAVLRKKEKCFFNSDSLEELFDFYFSKPEIAKCEKVLELARAQSPFSASFFIRRAQLQVHYDQIDKALELLDQGEILEASNFEIFLLRGALYDGQGRADLAESNYKKALKFSDEESKEIILSNLSNLYINNLKYKEAIQTLLNWFDVDAINELIVEDLSYCYSEIGDYKGGISILRKIIDKAPYNAQAWHNLALFLVKVNEPEEALFSLGYAIAIDDKLLPSVILKAEINLNQERIGDAIQAYNDALDLDSLNSQALCGLGMCYEKEKDYELAKKHYFEALENEHTLGSAWFGLGISELCLNNFEAAMYYCEKAVSLNPEEADYWYNLGECYHSLGQVEQAYSAYDQCLQLSQSYLEARLRLCSILHVQNELLEMLTVLENGLTHHEDDPVFMFRYAGFLLESGSKKVRNKAVGILMSVFSSSPNLIGELKKFHPKACKLQEVKAILGQV